MAGAAKCQSLVSSCSMQSQRALRLRTGDEEGGARCGASGRHGASRCRGCGCGCGCGWWRNERLLPCPRCFALVWSKPSAGRSCLSCWRKNLPCLALPCLALPSPALPCLRPACAAGLAASDRVATWVFSSVSRHSCVHTHVTLDCADPTLWRRRGAFFFVFFFFFFFFLNGCRAG